MKDLIAATFYTDNTGYKYPISQWEKYIKPYFDYEIFHHFDSIKNPGDIADAQNHYLDILQKDYKYVFWLQSDLMFRPGCEGYIYTTVGYDMAFWVDMFNNFRHVGVSYYGCCLVNKSRFSGDGAYLEPGGIHADANLKVAVDCGYLSKSIIKNHIDQQVNIWKERPNYDRPNLGMIMMYSGFYKNIIDDLGLKDEYKIELQNELNKL